MSPGNSADVKFEIGHVLFIDIVGYSNLLINEQSEQIQKLKEIVRGTEQVQIAEAEGKLMRLPTGDGGALVFRTTVEAPVLCSLEIAKALKNHPELRVRMGIHSGPVNEVTDLSAQANIAGAGINIAQRVMDCGDSRHILLSKHVAEDLEHYPRWRSYLHDLGECEVKHDVRLGIVNLYDEEIGSSQLPTKLQVLKKRRARTRWTAFLTALVLLTGILAALVIVAKRSAKLASIAPEKSIAVLPFENLSEEKANAYFAEGIQDEILTRLSKIADLKVISRTSTAKYKSRPENLKTIATELGVANILEGSVQKIGNDAHIAVQLIKARTDEHLWAQSYDRTLDHVFAVEGEVAQTVADALHLALVPAQIAKLQTLPTQNPQAYDLFLRGEYEFNRGWVEDVEYGAISKAAEYFREAGKIDPQFSLAYASAARAQLSEYHFRRDTRAERRDDLAEEAKRNIDHSLGLTPELATAHLALGEWHSWVVDDYPQAVVALERAISLDPHLTEAVIRLAGVAMRQGQPERALEKLRSALPIDPRNVVVHRWIGTALAMERQYSPSVESYTRALALNPNDLSDILNLARTYRAVGNLEAARRVLESYPPERRTDNAYLQGMLTLLSHTHDYLAMEELVNATPASSFSSEWDRLTTRGEIAQGLGRNAEARDLFAQACTAVLAAIRANPNDARTHAQLGSLNASLGHADEAIAEAQRAVELSEKKDFWEASVCLVSLAAVYAKLGRTQEAISVLTRLSAMPTGAFLAPDDLKTNPDWDPIRGDPRFKKIVASLAPKSGPKQ